MIHHGDWPVRYLCLHHEQINKQNHLNTTLKYAVDIKVLKEHFF